MATRLNWVASASAACFHAVRHATTGLPPAQPDVAEAVAAPADDLRRFLEHHGIGAAPLFAHLVPTAVTVAANRELALTTLAKTVGRERAAPLVERLAGLLTACEQAYFQAFPRILDELELRFRPLREQWEARGPGLLASVGRRTDRRLIVDEATVAVVPPIAGGGGSTHPPYNLITVEAVLANPLPQLPETVRMAWLLAALNADLPEFVELLAPGTATSVVQLATLPAVLESAADVELVRADDGLLAEALAAWHAPTPAGDRTASIVAGWWQFTRSTAAPWNVALTALEKLLGE